MRVKVTRKPKTGDQFDYGLVKGQAFYPDVTPNPVISNSIGAVPRDQANIEAEGGETVVGDINRDGYLEHFNINGPRHSKGGVPLNVPQGSFVFSDTPKMRINDAETLKFFGKTPRKGGYTPAQIAKQYMLNDDMTKVRDKDADAIAKRTAQDNLDRKTEKLAQLAMVQESMKGFPQGVPDIAMPLVGSEGAMMRMGGLVKAQVGLSVDMARKQYNKALTSKSAKEMLAAAQRIENATETPWYSWGWVPGSDQNELESMTAALKRTASESITEAQLRKRREALAPIIKQKADEVRAKQKLLENGTGNFSKEEVEQMKKVIDLEKRFATKTTSPYGDRFGTSSGAYAQLPSAVSYLYDDIEKTLGVNALTLYKKNNDKKNDASFIELSLDTETVGTKTASSSAQPAATKTQPAKTSAPAAPRPAAKPAPTTQELDAMAKELGVSVDYLKQTLKLAMGGELEMAQNGVIAGRPRTVAGRTLSYQYGLDPTGLAGEKGYDVIFAPQFEGKAFGLQTWDPKLGRFTTAQSSGDPYNTANIDDFSNRHGEIIANYPGGKDAFLKDLNGGRASSEKAADFFQNKYNEVYRSIYGEDYFVKGSRGADALDRKFGIYTFSAPGLKKRPAGPAPEAPAAPAPAEEVVAENQAAAPVAQPAPPKSWWLQDIGNFATGLMDSVESVEPSLYQVPIVQTDPTLLDPSRRIAARQEQYNQFANVAQNTADGQVARANMLAMSGEAAAGLSDDIANVENMNVGIVNQNTDANAQRMQAGMLANTQLRKAYDDELATLAQQQQNAERELRQRNLKNWMNGVTNAMKTNEWLPAITPQYRVNPLTGEIMYDKGKDATAPMGFYDTDAMGSSQANGTEVGKLYNDIYTANIQFGEKAATKAADAAVANYQRQMAARMLQAGRNTNPMAALAMGLPFATGATFPETE